MIDMMRETLCGGNKVEECIRAIDKQIAELKTKEDALDNKYLFEGFPKDKYDTMMAKLNTEKARLQVEKDELLKKKF